MLRCSEYKDWYNNQYLVKFPKPPRNEIIWNQNDLLDGFRLEKQTVYEMQYDFSLHSFIDFMLIQSNVNAKIESGEMQQKDVEQWMKRTLQPIFNNASQTLIFEGYNWYIRRC